MNEFYSDIQQLARANQYRLHPFALKRLSEFLSEVSRNSDEGTSHGILQDVFVLLKKQCAQDRFVDKEKVDAAISLQMIKIKGSLEKDGASSVKVVPLEAVPFVYVEETTGETRTRAVDADANRLHTIRQRYLLARSRCLRSGIYRADLKQRLAGGDDYLPLLPTTALEGLSPELEVGILGLLVRRTEGLVLEDLHGHIRVSPPTAVSYNSYIGCGFIVVVVGHWKHNTLHAVRIGLPPAEPRVSSASQHNQDFFGLAPTDTAAAITAERSSFRTVITFLAHVHLDKPGTLKQLSYFFQKMQERSEGELTDTTFVLIGSFTSTPNPPVYSGDASSSQLPNTLQNHLDILGSCIATHAPTAAQNSQFVLIPGPNDLTLLQGFLPQHPIATKCAKGLRARVKKLILAPNPCRLRFYTHEVVVARRDFLRAFQEAERNLGINNTIAAATSSSGAASELSTATSMTSFERIAKTVVDEAHLVPEASGGDAAVLWRLDDALRLPILPHTLLLCDSTEQWECYYKGVHVINPGSFSVNTTFLWYTPADGECSLSNLE